MEIDGQCHCGQVRYRARVDPANVSICHCTDCQALTGSPYRVTVLTARDSVTITAGEPATYVKIADSGRERLQLFCPRCGAPLFTTGTGEAAEIWGIRWGSIRQRAALRPTRQIWRRSAADWIDDLGALPSRPTD